jgi:tetratricopeptide (TPR) repeat protein
MRLCVATLVASAVWRGADADKDTDCTRGDELRRSGNMQAALAAYKTCIDRGGGDAVTRHNFGIALMDFKEYQDARRYLESAIALEPLLAASYAGFVCRPFPDMQHTPNPTYKHVYLLERTTGWVGSSVLGRL